MKNILKLSTLILFATSQFIGLAQTTRYYIQLSDKNNTPYTISNPQQFLTQRAIDRRTHQGLSVNETDLPVDPNYISQIAATGANVLYEVKWFNGVVIEISNGTQLTAVNNLSFVVSNTPVNVSKPTKDFEDIAPIESQSQKIEQVNSFYNYGTSLNQINMLNGVCLHDMGYNGTGMMIAVIDAGFANADTHPAFDSLRNNNQILGTKDFTYNAPASLYASNTSGHGTAVLGTMGGNWPGQLVGTAPKASYWLIRSEYANTENLVEEYNWAAAAAFADSVGADVINSSLGYNTFDVTSQSHTQAELDGNTSIASKAARMCARKGMVACISAGNSGGTSWPKIGFPADADSILTVGAVNGGGSYASFSSIGPTADGRIKPDVMAQGQGSVVANTDGSIGTSSGTSFSSPITAGMVASLWQAVPYKTNMEIIDAVKQSASMFSSPDNMYGYGIPDYCLAMQLASVKENPIESISISFSPNPSNGMINLDIINTNLTNIELNIMDELGRIIYKAQYTLQNGSVNTIRVDATQFAAGVYVAKLTSSDAAVDFNYTTKLIKTGN